MSTSDLFTRYIPFRKIYLTEKSFKRLSIEFIKDQKIITFHSNILHFQFDNVEDCLHSKNSFNIFDQRNLEHSEIYEILVDLHFYSSKHFEFNLYDSTFAGFKMKKEVLRNLIDKFFIFNLKHFRKGNFLIKLNLVWEDQVHNRIEISIAKIISIQR